MRGSCGGGEHVSLASAQCWQRGARIVATVTTSSSGDRCVPEAAKVDRTPRSMPLARWLKQARDRHIGTPRARRNRSPSTLGTPSTGGRKRRRAGSAQPAHAMSNAPSPRGLPLRSRAVSRGVCARHVECDTHKDCLGGAQPRAPIVVETAGIALRAQRVRAERGHATVRSTETCEPARQRRSRDRVCDACRSRASRWGHRMDIDCRYRLMARRSPPI